MWFACYTREEIADAVGLSHQAVTQILQEIADLQKFAKSARLAAEFGEALGGRRDPQAIQ